MRAGVVEGERRYADERCTDNHSAQRAMAESRAGSTSIKPLLLHMLERTHPDPVLREVVLEEWQCRTKCKDVVLRALGLQERSVDRGGLPSVDCDARQGHAASVA